MNDLDNLVPIAAKEVGVAPTTLLLALALMHVGAKVIARLIPDDKKGILGGVRKAANVIAAEPSSRITDGVSIKDVAAAAVVLPEVATRITEPRPQ